MTLGSFLLLFILPFLVAIVGLGALVVIVKARQDRKRMAAITDRCIELIKQL